MTKSSDADDLRAAARLLVEATLGVTRVVERMHLTIGSGPGLLGRPLALPFRWAVVPVYRAIRGVTRLTGATLDVVLQQLAPLLSDRTPGPQRMAMLAALNGVIGDRLEETGNRLAFEMVLSRNGMPLTLERAPLTATFPHAGKRLAILIHGSSMNEAQWMRAGHDHGAILEQSGDWVVLYLRYNSGRHISSNGLALASLLEQLVAAWPAPIEELALVGHSMGGLVARSACDVAERHGHAWRERLTRLVCIASPHHGAALERAGNWVDFLLEVSPYSAPLAALGKIRSAGITDLRHGNVRDQDWMGVDRFTRRKDGRSPLPLPSGVRCYAVAATRSPPGATRLRGDGLVSVESALGLHDRGELALDFPPINQLVVYATDHLGVLHSQEVATALRRWLGA